MSLSAVRMACQLVTTVHAVYNRERIITGEVPKKIIHPDDVLLIRILRINSDGGARLYPDVASILLHPAIVLGHALTLIQHWGGVKGDKTEQEA